MTSETGFLETNGARIYYEVEGGGEPVVLIHAGVAILRRARRRCSTHARPRDWMSCVCRCS